MQELNARIRIDAVTDAARNALKELLTWFEAVRGSAGKPLAPLPGAEDGAKKIGRAARDAEQAQRDLATTAGKPLPDPLPGAAQGTKRVEDAAHEAERALKGLHDTAGRLRDDRGRFLPAGEDSLQRMTGQAGELRSMLAGLLGLGAMTAMAREAVNLSDTWSGLTARMAVATGTAQANADTMAAAKRVAADYGQPLAEVGGLYVRLTNALKPLGGGLKEVNVLSEALAAALKKDGATTAEASSAILQYSQALSAGKLGGEEFNSIAEASPSLLTALASGLGVARGELKKMAEEGKLTSAAMTQALAKGLPQLQADAKAAGTSIGSGFTAINNALLEYVGKGMQSSGVSQALATGLKKLADNVGPVVDLMTALSTVAVAAALGRATAAVVGMVGPTLTLNGALAATQALLGGPIGLVVLVASLAAAWIGLSAAKKAATARTLEDMEAERAAVKVKQDELAAAAAKGNVGLNTQSQKYALDADARRLDAEIETKRREQEAKLRASAGPRGGGSQAGEELGSNLRETAVLKEFLDKHKGREAIVREYQDKMKSAESAFQKEIAAAEKDGDTARIAQLKTDFAAAKVQATKELNDKVKGMTKDAVVTRLASYKEEYDGAAALRQDAEKRALAENQRSYEAQQKSSREFFADRGRLEDAASDEAIAKLRKELAAREAVLETNRARLKQRKATGDANSVNEAEDAVKGGTSDVAKARAAIEEAVRDKATKSDVRANDERKVTEELNRQREALALQIREANGLITAEDIRAKIAAQYAQQRKKELAETGGTKQTDELINAQTRIAQLAQLKAKYGEIAATVRLTEQNIALDVENGVISTTEGERRKIAARQEAVPALQALIDKSRELAQTEGERKGVAQLVNDVGQLKSTTTEFERTLKSSGQSALGGFFSDIVSGSKTAGAAFKDMVDGFAKSMLDLVAKKMGEKLLDSLLGSAGGAAGGAADGAIKAASNWVGSFFHTGGVVGEGVSVTGNFHPATWNYAPRYHSGGIAGLRPDEVPAILQRGEEVLTADDPRHSRNGVGMGGVNINVNVSGADGSKGEQGGAGKQLARMVEDTVNRWAVTQSRPGGILAKG